ncbi:MAG: RNA polymerase sigma factor [Bacteroidales bacterium]|nr:RNA polymerase sigma factor [Bacteroidales bacterium]
MVIKAEAGLSDEEIIRNILNGKKDQFAILYSRYKKKVLDKCFSILKDRSLAIELEQEIFSKVYEKLPGYKGIASFSSWLYAITYNHSIEYLRQRKKLNYPEWNRSNELPEAIDEIDQTDKEGLRYERLVKIMEMIHPEEKALLLMKYQDDIPIKLIMSTFRISESAAKMRIKRAKARVSYLYKKMYPNEDNL